MRGIDWEFEAKKHAAAAGEMRIQLAYRLEAVQADIAALKQMLMHEDNELDRVTLEWRIKQKQQEGQWLENILDGRGQHDKGTGADISPEG